MPGGDARSVAAASTRLIIALSTNGTVGVPGSLRYAARQFWGVFIERPYSTPEEKNMENDSSSRSEKATSGQVRRSYGKPRLTRFGALPDITKQISSMDGNSDGGFDTKTV